MTTHHLIFTPTNQSRSSTALSQIIATARSSPASRTASPQTGQSQLLQDHAVGPISCSGERNPDDYVDGMAYYVETKERQKMLEYYETILTYSVVGIRIMIEGQQVSGRTFMWSGDKEELTEGSWSLDKWKKGVEEEIGSYFEPAD
ncbi:hypothetical protein V8E51_003594 [Hyaloscypha variabilis]|jgi:hypothetical protein|uniref:Gamma-glutamylcyclotransferase AIG2-like domain-containing protein n=1 Tax=Hyaloscypha variabilis (strain UAMH 11265 / GT02V1 / F) TaxID=1149755 RepID=A0A2J6SC19_HYAVF|nr:hypothetical protein L207DRAFT_521710 [Hyaloscypha variabilis F]